MTSRGRRRPRRSAPPGEFEAAVDDLAHDGRGVAKPGGKTTFIRGALPGETVRFSYTASHSRYDEARTLAIAQPSADRTEPPCAHFGVCGGCALQHLKAERQIAYKQEWLLENLQRIGKVTPAEVLPPLTGPALGYRLKARLGVKYVTAKGRVLVGFRELDAPFVADLQRCEVLHPKVGTLLPALAELIQGLSIYDRLPQIEVALGDDPDCALSLRVLDPPDNADLERLHAFADHYRVDLYLQPKGPASTVALRPDTAPLSYRLTEFGLRFEFLPYHFTQVNPAVNRQMVARAVELLDLDGGQRVLDLFCGLGNFSLALARRAAQITGIEGDHALVEWAARNARSNDLDNAEFIAADLSQPDPDAPWLNRHYDRVLLDPPRSGAQVLSAELGRLAAPRLVYVSCHPATLARDLGLLVHEYGYRLQAAGVMDMFPHTAHVESIALLERA